jgi:hypothetical protein
MNTLTLKIPLPMDEALSAVSARANISKSELVRRALSAYLSQLNDARGLARPASALDLAADLVGCFGGGPADLSSNPRHLDDFGQH